ncbi:ataxin-8-like [Patiria miniata]|uniref:Uncharacterized protein n=1 Tax=Patiria miniata TaxID=46514 RepID=A0A913Z4B5_PATMI|nr:ataxin-8-like [Patiria miniata]
MQQQQQQVVMQRQEQQVVMQQQQQQVLTPPRQQQVVRQRHQQQVVMQLQQQQVVMQLQQEYRQPRPSSINEKVRVFFVRLRYPGDEVEDKTFKMSSFRGRRTDSQINCV